MAGYSIRIYHITLEEANRVRREMGLPKLDDPGTAAPGSEQQVPGTGVAPVGRGL